MSGLTPQTLELNAVYAILLSGGDKYVQNKGAPQNDIKLNMNPASSSVRGFLLESGVSIKADQILDICDEMYELIDAEKYDDLVMCVNRVHFLANGEDGEIEAEIDPDWLYDEEETVH